MSEVGSNDDGGSTCMVIVVDSAGGDKLGNK